MKKITLVLVVLISSLNHYFGQAVIYHEAPLPNSTTQVRAPNGLASQAYLRACALVLQTELTNIPNNTSISLFGFTLSTATTPTSVSTPVSGNFTVYLQNTSDLTYQKGTNWATIPTGMTSVYANVMTIPLSSTSTSIILTLSTPFVYTGGGIYVAYDWESTGPFSTTPATYYAEGLALNPGCASAASGVAPAPTTLGTTGFRPTFLFGYNNPYTNDVQVVGLEAPGNIAGIFNTPHTVNAVIKNSSSANLTNIPVTLNVTGSNPSTLNQTIPALTAGATTVITFPALNPTLPGIQTISVSVAADQNNINNSKTYAQNITCNVWSQNPAAGNFTSNAVGFGAGTGIVATPFLNPATSTIVGIRAAISNNAASIGNNIYGVLLNSAGAVLATTNTVTITNAMLTTIKEFTYALPQNLNPSTTYYLGMAQLSAPNSTYYPAGTQNIGYQPANLYFSTTLTGGVLTPIAQNYGYFGLEAVLAHSLNVTAVSSPTAICTGTCATINAQGTGTITWSNSSTGSSIIICPTVTTTYSLSNTTTLGCTSSAAITVTVNPIPNVTAISSKTSVCIGGSVTLTSSGASTYSWDLGPTTNTMTDAPIATTIYTVTGTSAFGCSKSNTVEVIVNSFTPGISSPTAICRGNSTGLQASGGAGNSYTWSTNFVGFPNLPAITPSITTIYSVTSIDINGCKGTNATTVTVNPNPTVTAVAQKTAICKGETTTFTASGASTYSWSTNSSNTTIAVTPTIATSITYTVIGTDAVTGCFSSDDIILKVNACTGLSEVGNYITQIRIFPNPSTGVFSIYTPANEEFFFVKIYNTLGSLLQEQRIESETTEIDIQSQTKGLYFVHIYQGNKSVHIAKVIKN